VEGRGGEERVVKGWDGDRFRYARRSRVKGVFVIDILNMNTLEERMGCLCSPRCGGCT